MSRGLTAASVVLALFFAPTGVARAMDFSFQGYVDVRVVAPPREKDWLDFGLSKFRYDGNLGLHFAEGIGQGNLSLTNDLNVIVVARAEPKDRDVFDALESYAYWHPAADGALSWSAKAGAFFPTISLENDDLGWASPYTLTPSAINSWIGEELRTIGGEGTLRWKTENAGTFSVLGSIFCCNDPAGILLADRGWAMDDRPTGLFERIPESDATMRLFHTPVGQHTGEFEEIDGQWGWYAGLGWQMANIGKLTVLRYDNQADPAAKTSRDTSWETKFWSFGARTQFGPLVLIAQQLTGYTAFNPRGTEVVTKFQSGFLLASYDLDPDWRVSARADYFQTRHIAATPNVMSEDGHAITAAVSWSGTDWLRITGEVLAMESARPEYLSDGFPVSPIGQAQYQLSARLFF